MTTKYISLGGIFMALYLVINYFSNISSGFIQTYSSIIKILIIVLYMNQIHFRFKESFCFLFGCLVLSVILISLQTTLTYSIPCMFQGSILAFLIYKKFNRVIEWGIFIISSMIAYIYKFYMILWFTGIRITDAFEKFGIRFLELLPIQSINQTTNLIIIVFCFIVDLLVTNTIIYYILKFLLKRLRKIGYD